MRMQISKSNIRILRMQMQILQIIVRIFTYEPLILTIHELNKSLEIAIRAAIKKVPPADVDYTNNIFNMLITQSTHGTPFSTRRDHNHLVLDHQCKKSFKCH
jgi:hypothetical protein